MQLLESQNRVIQHSGTETVRLSNISPHSLFIAANFTHFKFFLVVAKLFPFYIKLTKYLEFLGKFSKTALGYEVHPTLVKILETFEIP